MTLEILGLVALVTCMMAAFLSERVSPEIAAISVLLILIFGGYLTPAEAFSGFSSKAALTLVAMFIIGSGLYHTGFAELVGHNISKRFGHSETATVAAIMVVTAGISSFMNNVAAVAIMLPTVAGISRRSNIPLSLLLMPLSFAAILGGTLTLIGTAPNIVASQMLADANLPPLKFFSFLPFGLLIVACGILFMVFFGLKLLPRNESTSKALRKEDLTSLYKLHERIFTLKVPAGSRLHGKTLAELHFGESLDLAVVSIERPGKHLLAPGPEETLYAGDTLIVRGRFFELEELLKLRGMEVHPISNIEQHLKERGITTIAFRVPPALTSKTLRDLDVRERFGFIVASIQRGDELIFSNLASEKLQAGDVLHSLGDSSTIHELAHLLELSESSLTDLQQKDIKGAIFSMKLPPASPLAGATIQSSKIGELTGITIIGLIRQDEIMFPVSVDQALRVGDIILAAGDVERARALARLGELEVTGSQSPQTALESSEIGIMEVVVSPRSQLIGKTLEQIRFRERYDALVLALWREGRPLRARLSRTPLKFGDALLLQGRRRHLQIFASDPDFVALAEAPKVELRTGKIGFAMLSLFVMFLIEFLGIHSEVVAAWTAAMMLVLSGAVTVEETYREIDWRAVFLVAALLPMGMAFQKTGATPLFADWLGSAMGGSEPLAVLALLTILACLISQSLDASFSVILLAPVAIALSQNLALPPSLVVMVVALASSNAFIASFNRCNLLVMGIGGYNARDYFRVGLGITFVHFIAMAIAVYAFGWWIL
ncbi:MAG: SLC13 family permease [Deltaproteobacteria bacterium]|nr:SLC13 family permease [Deltaproteobacteria bacterium]